MVKICEYSWQIWKMEKIGEIRKNLVKIGENWWKLMKICGKCENLKKLVKTKKIGENMGKYGKIGENWWK